MKREKLIILLGILMALVFFYLGLNEWLKTKEERIQPPPVTVKPTSPKQPTTTEEVQKKEPEKTTNIQGEEKPQQRQETPIVQKVPTQEAKEEVREQKKEEQHKKTKVEQKDLIAQKVKQEKEESKPKNREATAKLPEKKELKVYTVQIGAFKDKERARGLVERANSMGYEAKVVEEDNFYKVRLTVRTNNINQELGKLRKTFGGAILKQ
ncbi:MAG: SPOR domain-containing protein [Aquificaceae bacterium]|nr:SPOR domain-containing protein [Aquificaceae bacterium]